MMRILVIVFVVLFAGVGPFLFNLQYNPSVYLNKLYNNNNDQFDSIGSNNNLFLKNKGVFPPNVVFPMEDNLTVLQQDPSSSSSPILVPTGPHIFVSSNIPTCNQTSQNQHQDCVRYWPIIMDGPSLEPIENQQELQQTNETHSKDLNASSFQASASLFPSDLAVLTMGGHKHRSSIKTKANQDRIFFLQPFRLDAKTTSSHDEPDFLLGLFDGHGVHGHFVSHYAAILFPRVLAQCFSHFSSADEANPNNLVQKAVIHRMVNESMYCAFRGLNQGLKNLAEPTNNHFAFRSGSTGIAIWKYSHSLYIANVGDSTAAIVEYDAKQRGKETHGFAAVKPIFRTKPHKPHRPEERERIERLGGEVRLANRTGLSSRVIFQDGMVTVSLAMSRSLGDLGAKSIGVVADPTVVRVDLQKQEQGKSSIRFVVAATDGLLDRISLKEVAGYLGEVLWKSSRPGFESTSSNEHLVLHEACQQLVQAASESWARMGIHYRDDISMAVKLLL